MRHAEFVIMALVALSGCEAKDPCEQPFSCPDEDVIDCMPPSQPDSPCVDDGCLSWIEHNCPDVQIVH